MSKHSLEANQPERTLRVTFANSLRDLPESSESPIDEFIATRSDANQRAGNADAVILSLLMVHVVSGCERYIRRVISEVASVCPSVGERVFTQHAPIGAHSYYGKSTVALAALEHTSLSDLKNIKKTTNDLLGIDIRPKTSIMTAIEDFDRVCQLRHGIIHGAGRVGYQNLVIMKVRPLPISSCEVFLDLASFQEAVALVENTVRAYNQFVFDEILERWIRDSVLSGDWKANDRKVFTALYRIFVSARDGSAGKDRSAYDAYKRTIQAKLTRRGGR